MVYFSESQTLIKINFYVARNASCNRVGGPVYLCVAPTSSTRAASFLQIRRPLVSHFPRARSVVANPGNAWVDSPVLWRVLDIIQAANTEGDPQAIFERIESALRADSATLIDSTHDI